MTIIELIADSDWDAPFFKRLARNDTRQASGHQGGPAIPVKLRPYLPTLNETATSFTNPTTDRYLSAELFLGAQHLLDVSVRYQFQTWGGTRPPEGRITEGFAPLHREAREGDVLILQRRIDTVDRFRMILATQNHPEFPSIAQLTGDRRVGELFLNNPPVSQDELALAVDETTQTELQPFQVVRSVIPRVESRQTRIARSIVFRERVRNQYDSTCAVSGIRLATPAMLLEVESAHVVPISDGGCEDVRNGLTLTRTLHWAFDRGLFGVSSERKVVLPQQVRQMPSNSFLKSFENKPILEARSEQYRVHSDALRWHYDNLVARWE